jgi:F-type H+-transporting ATPase subunit delta
MSQAVASRYASALADVVLAPGSTVTPEQALAQLAALEGLLSGSTELRTVLLSPAVAASRKRGAVRRIGESLNMPATVRNFLYVIIDHRRVGLLKTIRQEVEAQFDARRGVVRALVTSARPLSASQRPDLEAALERRTGKKIRGEYRTDESLIGGMVVRAGSKVFDGSVRGQLETLRRRLTSD